MEKLKSFFSNPKKMAVLGLIASIISIVTIIYYSMGYVSYGVNTIFYKAHMLGLLVYFLIVCIRLYKGKGNIKFANYFLIFTYGVSLVMQVLKSIEYGVLEKTVFLYVIFYVMMILYFCNILLRRINLLNNDIFATFIVTFILFRISYAIPFFSIENFIAFRPLILEGITYIAVIPYFYNYYNLVKGSEKNG